MAQPPRPAGLAEHRLQPVPSAAFPLLWAGSWPVIFRINIPRAARPAEQPGNQPPWSRADGPPITPSHSTPRPCTLCWKRQKAEVSMGTPGWVFPPSLFLFICPLFLPLPHPVPHPQIWQADESAHSLVPPALWKGRSKAVSGSRRPCGAS